jgi:hypothetical protein
MIGFEKMDSWRLGCWATQLKVETSTKEEENRET